MTVHTNRNVKFYLPKTDAAGTRVLLFVFSTHKKNVCVGK